MAKKSILQRIKITKSGKVLRRAGGLSHSRANKRSVEMQRKQRQRGLHINKKEIKRYL
jgi:ribosomal protein L35